MTFVLSFFEWPLRTGFTILVFRLGRVTIILASYVSHVKISLLFKISDIH